MPVSKDCTPRGWVFEYDLNHMENNIFRLFCHYVDERIFSRENMGSYVAFVVDQSFVNDFCKENNTTENALMLSVRKELCSFQRNHLTAKGVIAIQLFAATKRANNSGLTAKAYYVRLSQVLGWPIESIKNWMEFHQDKVWSILYNWCDNNNFRVIKTERRSGPYCYVQYPLNLSLRIFTDEDLIYIAKIFVDNNLHPGEDITSYHFWKLINKFSLSRYYQTGHASEVIYNSISEDDYLQQIYNYYLRWDGIYKVRDVVKYTTNLQNVFMYLTEDLKTIELRDNNLNLLNKFSVEDSKPSEIHSHFPLKRKGLLLFKKDDVYDNRWQEVRYLDKESDDYSKGSTNYGILLCFQSEISYSFKMKLKVCEVLYENRNVIIYKLIRRSITEDFFTEKRFYELYGGLKIGRNIYLKGATPILRLHKPTMVWVDGNAIKEEPIKEDISLNHLEVGNHIIKIPNSKTIKIDIVEPSYSVLEWQDNYNRWNIGKSPAVWRSENIEQGIVGLNFSSISSPNDIIYVPITKRWAMSFAFGKYNKKENNIAINLTKPHNENI